MHINKVNWFSKYRVHHRVTNHFKVGRAFLLGDAGHIHSPVGGQGMNTGIGDAVNLSWKLAEVIQGRANASILDTYEPERIAFAHALLSTTDKVFSLMTGTDVGHLFFRETIFPHLMPFLLGFSGMRTGAFKLLSQTHVNYQDSMLSVGDAGEIHAGDRLPWVTFGPGSDNFEPLISFDWQVHVYGVAGDELRAATKNLNIGLHEFEWTDLTEQAGFTRDAMHFIRPDGYIGLVSSSQDIDQFENYLKKFNLVSGKDSNVQPPEPPKVVSSGPLPQEQTVGIEPDDPYSPDSIDRRLDHGGEDVLSEPRYGTLHEIPDQMPVM
jgi:hypothetical protein